MKTNEHDNQNYIPEISCNKDEQNTPQITEKTVEKSDKTPAIHILMGIFTAVLTAVIIYIICGNPFVRCYTYFMAVCEVLFMFIIYLIFRRLIVTHRKTKGIKSFLFYLITFMSAGLGNAFFKEIGGNSDPYTIAPSLFSFLGMWIIPIATFIIADRIRFSYQKK